MTTKTTFTQEQQIKQIEADLCKKYYQQFPDGDARYDLWPSLLKAKKQSDPIAALNELYEEYGLDKE